MLNKRKAKIERIIEVVSFLANHYLAFGGQRGEGISSLSEPGETISEDTGNLLAMIRPLAKYYVILAEHLQRGKGNKKVSPTSPTEVKMK